MSIAPSERCAMGAIRTSRATSFTLHNNKLKNSPSTVTQGRLLSSKSTSSSPRSSLSLNALRFTSSEYTPFMLWCECLRALALQILFLLFYSPWQLHVGEAKESVFAFVEAFHSKGLVAECALILNEVLLLRAQGDSGEALWRKQCGHFYRIVHGGSCDGWGILSPLWSFYTLRPVTASSQGRYRSVDLYTCGPRSIIIPPYTAKRVLPIQRKCSLPWSMSLAMPKDRDMNATRSRKNGALTWNETASW